MGWRLSSQHWLSAKSTTRHYVSWNSDKGTQFIMAHPVTESNLEVTRFEKEKSCAGVFYYYVIIKNLFNFWVKYSIEKY